MKQSPRARPLSHLDPIGNHDDIVAVIETPRDTRTKLAYDETSEAFVVKKVLPEGLSFPFEFGFIPSTLGGDGDPLDVLVLLDEAVPTGTIVPSRLIGVIEAEQTEPDGTKSENDRLIAVGTACEVFRDVKRLKDLPGAVVTQIEHFFVVYNQEEGKRFKIAGRHGRNRANKLLQSGMRRYRRATPSKRRARAT